MKKLLIYLLSAAMISTVLYGCNNTEGDTGLPPETELTQQPETEAEPSPETDDNRVNEDTVLPGTDKTVGEVLEGLDGPVRPQGEITEIWFDEIFGAFYPIQLKSMVFTKQYIYGDVASKQPVLCLCSQRITDVTVFSASSGEELYTVPELLPMEAVVLMVELSDKPEFGVRFNDEAGKAYSYILTKHPEEQTVIYTAE